MVRPASLGDAYHPLSSLRRLYRRPSGHDVSHARRRHAASHPAQRAVSLRTSRAVRRCRTGTVVGRGASHSLRVAELAVNRAAERLALVTDRSVRCPECRGYMEFKTDRAGRAMEVCACGYRAYIERRTGKRDEEPKN